MTTADEGFTDFSRSAGTGLLRRALLLTGDQELAKDLVQETLAKLYVAWPRLTDDGAAVYAYARTTMTRTLISWRRRRRYAAEVLLESLPEPASVTDASFEDRDLLLRAMRGLAPRERSAVVLRYFEDLTEAQTAEVMGCSVGAVKGYTSRGLAKLRSGLAEHVEITGRVK
ncbi:SigE family RNA polymerase sigma factor [Knoellia sp. 3-2P3]|uniref:SigE family RNA polymerase sigma factor n=1 Tax=unclassified Knoellia TaxID=2618719 RepID=UPI0023DB05CE|nr:SigE family RNA polymerase sigma factor [Knoellia sp. 3-2P3]MDF2091094.1 SigE family RNA polymerase sigma factor [Knoellia sp. 3-2P3]